MRDQTKKLEDGRTLAETVLTEAGKPESKVICRRTQTDRYESKLDRTGFMLTSDKENSIFYLKLQWISAKDDAERASLGKRIRELLNA